MIGRTRRHSAAHFGARQISTANTASFAFGLPLLSLLALLLAATTSACATTSGAHARSIPPAPTIAVPVPSPTIAADAAARIHHASAEYIPLFASITFTGDTTYDQAVAILNGHVYPWTCDEPRSDDHPSLAQQRARFAASHTLLMSYPTWDELLRIASSPQVITVDGTVLYPCP